MSIIGISYQLGDGKGMEETLNPFIRRILAPNPSPMTFLGTNTYLLGKKEVAVIDPVPESIFQ